MTDSCERTRFITLILVICITFAPLGCKSDKGTGTLAGAGAGALIGQAIGRNTEGTLIGAGVGAGVGYLIGNEMDKKKAREKKEAEQRELQPLAGTTWQLTSITPESARTFASMVIEFRRDGILFTTRTDSAGQIRTDEERYRIVGSTLIVNDTDYLINGQFTLDGRTLTIHAATVTTTWTRVGG